MRTLLICSDKPEWNSPMTNDFRRRAITTKKMFLDEFYYSKNTSKPEDLRIAIVVLPEESIVEWKKIINEYKKGALTELENGDWALVGVKKEDISHLLTKAFLSDEVEGMSSDRIIMS